jgi:hypothetical protein
MVLFYCRKTWHAVTSKDATKRTVEEVNDWKSIHQVAKNYLIHYPTLQWYFHKYKDNTSTRLSPTCKNCKVFSVEQGKDLANYLSICSKMTMLLTLKWCRHFAYELAVKNNLNYPGYWKERLTGIDWFYGLRKQTPDVSITPGSCSLSWATSIKRHNISAFFINLEQVLHRCPAPADGARIISSDETSTSTVPQNCPQILTKRETSKFLRLSLENKVSWLPPFCMISAGGTILPLAMMHPQVHVK